MEAAHLEEARAIRQLKEFGAMALVVLFVVIALGTYRAQDGISSRDSLLLLAVTVAGLQAALLIVKVRSIKDSHAQVRVDTLPLSDGTASRR